MKNQQKEKNQTPQKKVLKKSLKKRKFKKSFKRNPLKREFHKSLVSEHIIQIHAIEPAVFEFSSHEGIVVRVDGGDFKP